MPAVYGEQPATCDRHGCRYAEVGERVGRNVCHGRVGGKLEHHDDILLHLILKHQRALGKETLVRQTEKEKGRERERARGRRVGWRKGDGDEGRGTDRTDGTEGRQGKRYISGSTGSEQVHTLRAALGLGKEADAPVAEGSGSDGFGLTWMALM